MLSFLCKRKPAISHLLRRGSPRRGVSPFFPSSSCSSKKQIYSPALCPTKTNSPWTRNQSPAGYVFYLCLSFLEVDVLSSDLERERLAAFFAFESSSSDDERSKHRKIFAPVVLSVEKALTRKNERNERFLTRALFLSLSTCDKHTHTRIKI